MTETKEELIKRIAELESENKRLAQELADKSAVNRGSGEHGWLITCRNQDYNGSVGGVLFVNGRAFIPMSDENASLKVLQLCSDFGFQSMETTSKEFEAGNKPARTKEKSFLEKVSISQVS